MGGACSACGKRAAPDQAIDQIPEDVWSMVAVHLALRVSRFARTSRRLARAVRGARKRIAVQSGRVANLARRLCIENNIEEMLTLPAAASVSSIAAAYGMWDVVRAYAALGVAPCVYAEAYAWSLGLAGVSSDRFVTLEKPKPELIVETPADAERLARELLGVEDPRVAAIRSASPEKYAELLGLDVWVRRRSVMRDHRDENEWWFQTNYNSWDVIVPVSVIGSNGTPYAVSYYSPNVAEGFGIGSHRCFDDWPAIPQLAFRSPLIINLRPWPNQSPTSLIFEYLALRSPSLRSRSAACVRFGPKHLVVANMVPHDAAAHRTQLCNHILRKYGVLLDWCQIF